MILGSSSIDTIVYIQYFAFHLDELGAIDSSKSQSHALAASRIQKRLIKASFKAQSHMSLSMELQAWKMWGNILLNPSRLRSQPFSISAASAWKARHNILDSQKLSEKRSQNSARIVPLAEKAWKIRLLHGDALGNSKVSECLEVTQGFHNKMNYAANYKEIIKVDTISKGNI